MMRVSSIAVASRTAMPYFDHAEVVKDQLRIRVHLPDPPERILVVETRMPISSRDPGFDQEEYDGLVEAVRAGMERAGAEEAEIVSLTGR
jgi:hypothetical protein